METCIEQLKEIKKVEEANMPDSHHRLCGGQYSSVSVNVFVLQYFFKFYLCYTVIKELGGIHVERGDLSEALTCYKEALELYQQEDTSYHVKIADSLITFLTQHDIIFLKRLSVFCSALTSIARIYDMMGNITDAVKHYEQSIEIREQKQLPPCREAGLCMQ